MTTKQKGFNNVPSNIYDVTKQRTLIMQIEAAGDYIKDSQVNYLPI